MTAKSLRVETDEDEDVSWGVGARPLDGGAVCMDGLDRLGP